MNPLALIGGGSNALAALGLVVSLGGGAALYWHEHDNRIVAEVAAKAAVATAQAQHDDDQRTISGLTIQASLDANRLAKLSTLKEAIHAAPTTNACSSSPAVRALVSGLRSAADRGNGSPPTSTPVSVGVPGPAAAAR